MGCIYKTENCKNHFKIVRQTIFKKKKKLTWQLMWRNVKAAAALNATLQLLVIYRLCITVMTITNENTINGLLLGISKNLTSLRCST